MEGLQSRNQGGATGLVKSPPSLECKTAAAPRDICKEWDLEFGGCKLINTDTEIWPLLAFVFRH